MTTTAISYAFLVGAHRQVQRYDDHLVHYPIGCLSIRDYAATTSECFPHSVAPMVSRTKVYERQISDLSATELIGTIISFGQRRRSTLRALDVLVALTITVAGSGALVVEYHNNKKQDFPSFQVAFISFDFSLDSYIHSKLTLMVSCNQHQPSRSQYASHQLPIHSNR
jgi:hypothetical protein